MAVKLPEDGMGYQYATVHLADGSIYPNVLIVNSDTICGNYPFDASDVVKLTREKGDGRGLYA